MIKILSFFLTFFILFTAGTLSVCAVTETDDVFGNKYVEFDANMDGFFDIKDFIRVKKYFSGAPVILNINLTDLEISGAELLAVMERELLET